MNPQTPSERVGQPLYTLKAIQQSHTDTELCIVTRFDLPDYPDKRSLCLTYN